MHRIWLGGIYPWAGRYRQVNLVKHDFPFAAAAQIPQLMETFEEGPQNVTEKIQTVPPPRKNVGILERSLALLGTRISHCVRNDRMTVYRTSALLRHTLQRRDGNSSRLCCAEAARSALKLGYAPDVLFSLISAATRASTTCGAAAVAAAASSRALVGP